MSNYSTKGTKMAAKFAACCGSCKGAIEVGDEMVYYAQLRPGSRVWHVDCARAESLKGRIFTLGMKSMQDDFYEAHWLGLQAKAIAERDGLMAGIAARLAA